MTIGLKPAVAFVVVDSAGVFDWAFATWVPAKAKNRNMVVPTHSPIAATNMFFTSLFIHIVHGNRDGIAGVGYAALRAFVVIGCCGGLPILGGA